METKKGKVKVFLTAGKVDLAAYPNSAPDLEVLERQGYRKYDPLSGEFSDHSEIMTFRAYGHIWAHGPIKDGAYRTRFFYNRHACGRYGIKECPPLEIFREGEDAFLVISVPSGP